MSKHQVGGITWPYAVTTFLGALLLFLVQPLFSKLILPWFGGSPAVWTTCMLFFQVVLLLGYAYAYLLVRLRPRRQIALHAALLLAALPWLPITPGASWEPDGSGSPTWSVLLLLASHVGVPYLLLSTTAPLVQVWYARSETRHSPYRLYALSNAGSLLALVGYPFLFEPLLGLRAQDLAWSAGLVVYALTCGWLLWMTWSGQRGHRVAPVAAGGPTARVARETEQGRPGWRQWSQWLCLPALGSVMLLAVTNHICQDVAVVPLLWVAPLGLYLLSFIICFDRERWYVRRWFGLATAIAILAVSNLALGHLIERLYQKMGVSVPLGQLNRSLPLVIGAHLAMLFLVCMVCHGELVRAKPPPKWLTSFYLCVATGGALGGLLVALACPLVFSQYLELSIGMLASFCLAVGALFRGGGRWFARPWVAAVAGLTALVGFVVVALAQVATLNVAALAVQRSFYGVLSVREFHEEIPELHGRALYHGGIMHGYQFLAPDRRRIPTLYYDEQSGVGLLFRRFPRQKPLRVGAVGLGTGTTAAYGRAGDSFRFYEIDPDVEQFAREYFTFLADSPAKIDVRIGDARLSLENEEPQQFDFLLLDAFSGDAVPTHLLTHEAFATYTKHLSPDGVIAVHVSNRYLDLMRVVRGLSRRFQLPIVLVVNRRESASAADSSSTWALLTRNQQFLRDGEVRARNAEPADQREPELLWSDQYSNLFEVLR